MRPLAMLGVWFYLGVRVMAFDLAVVPGLVTNRLEWDRLGGVSSYSIWWSTEPNAMETGEIVGNTTRGTFDHVVPEGTPVAYYVVAGHVGNRFITTPERVAMRFRFEQLDFYSPMVIRDFDRDGTLGFVLGDPDTVYPDPIVDFRGLETAVPYPFIRARGGTGDFDGDGWDDFVTSPYAPTRTVPAESRRGRLYLNDRSGRFVESASYYRQDVQGFTETTVAADFDNDGDLDLFIPVYPNKNPNKNWLLLNDGTGAFQDVAEAAGVGIELWHLPEGAQAVDFNDDGWLDIYVSSRFFINQGLSDEGVPLFEEALFGLERRFDEGAKLIDWNRDGLWDIVENHPSSGPVLYENDGSIFVKVDVLPALPEGERDSSWGLNVCDINNDGWSDFFIGGGRIDEVNASPLLFINSRDAFQLSDVLDTGGSFSSSGAVADFDQNGSIDLAMLIADSSVAPGSVVGVFYNTLDGGNPVTIELRDHLGRANQQGREIRLIDADNPHRPMMGLVDGGSGWLACNPYPVRFAVADPSKGYGVTAKFATGSVEVADVRAGENLVIYPGGAVQSTGFARAFADEDILEGSEDGRDFIIELLGMEWAEDGDGLVLGVEHLEVVGLPAGVSLAAVARESVERLRVTLQGNATMDYHRDRPLLRMGVRKEAVVSAARDLAVDSKVILLASNRVPTILDTQYAPVAYETYPYRSTVTLDNDPTEPLIVENYEGPDWLELDIESGESIVLQGSPPVGSTGTRTVSFLLRDQAMNEVSGSFMVTVRSQPPVLTFAQWVDALVNLGYPAELLLPTGDPEGDLFFNLLEFGLGGGAFVFDEPLITLEVLDTEVLVRLPRTPDVRGLVYKLQRSGQLAGVVWEDVGGAPVAERNPDGRITRTWRVVPQFDGREYYRVLVEEQG